LRQLGVPGCSSASMTVSAGAKIPH
jgi:hypothetical protein